jgi:thiol-disulfide isomerase/thioredoxin
MSTFQLSNVAAYQLSVKGKITSQTGKAVLHRNLIISRFYQAKGLISIVNTDREGNFDVTLSVRGPIFLRFAAAHHESVLIPILVFKDEVLEIDVKLKSKSYIQKLNSIYVIGDFNKFRIGNARKMKKSKNGSFSIKILSKQSVVKYQLYKVLFGRRFRASGISAGTNLSKEKVQYRRFGSYMSTTSVVNGAATIIVDPKLWPAVTKKSKIAWKRNSIETLSIYKLIRNIMKRKRLLDSVMLKISGLKGIVSLCDNKYIRKLKIQMRMKEIERHFTLSSKNLAPFVQYRKSLMLGEYFIYHLKTSCHVSSRMVSYLCSRLQSPIAEWSLLRYPLIQILASRRRIGKWSCLPAGDSIVQMTEDPYIRLELLSDTISMGRKQRGMLGFFQPIALYRNMIFDLYQKSQRLYKDAYLERLSRGVIVRTSQATLSSKTKKTFLFLKAKIEKEKKMVLRKKYSLVYFWASWCTPCRRAVPLLQKTARKYSRFISFVSVQLERPGEKRTKKNSPFADKWIKVTAHRAFQSKIARGFQIYFVPSLVLLDSGGVTLLRSPALTIGNLQNRMKNLLGRKNKSSP